MSGAPERLKSTRLTRRPSGARRMDELGRVLLEVGPGDPDRDGAFGRVERQPAVGGQRDLVLADLVALRQVRVEVVLALPAGLLGRARLDRDPGCENVLHGRPVDRGHGAGQAEADRAAVGVRRSSVIRRRARAEHLRRGLELAVDLDPDHGLVALECRGAAVGRRGRHATPPARWRSTNRPIRTSASSSCS